MDEQNLFHINSEIIKRRWPEILKSIELLDGELDVTIEDQMPEITLIFEGKHLSSGYNRAHEATVQNSNIPLSAIVAHLYGVGLGDAACDLLKRKHLTRLEVYILSPVVFYIYISLFDATHWLDDPRLHMQLAHDVPLVFPYSVNAAELYFAEESTLSLKNQIEIDKNSAYQQYYQQTKLHALNVANKNKNKLFLDADPYITDLRNKYQGVRFVLVAGGPTASDQWAWMKQQRDEFILIAASTALIPLEMEGLIPDYVVAIDSLVDLARHFKVNNPQLYQNKILVYCPTTSNEAVKLWSGKRYISLPRVNPIVRALADQRPEASLYSGGSVAHTMASFALFLGASEVILVGYDFCFVNQQSHVKNNPLYCKVPENIEYWVLNGHQNKAPSLLNLLGYKEAMEEYIAAHPLVTFYNTGREGAEIKGAQWL